MGDALAVARLAAAAGDVPVGAVLLGPDGAEVARAGNRREADNDPLGHAEILVIRKAAELLGTWRLTDCSLVVTLEPCSMCAGAIVQARVSRLVFGAFDAKAGAVGSLWDVVRDRRLDRQPEVISGVRAAESTALLQEFFDAQR